MTTDPEDIPRWLVWLAGGGAGAPVVVWLFRRAWRQISMEGIDTRKDQAEATLYQKLREEISALRAEIDEMKAEHATEKEQLEQRICGMNDKLEALSRKYRAMQMQALDCYVLLARSCTNHCGVFSDLKQHLLAMIQGDRKTLPSVTGAAS